MLGPLPGSHAAQWADELVSDVAHGADELFLLRAELGAQPPHMNVDRAGAAEEVVAPHLLQQLGAGEHPAGMLREVLEQLELLVSEVQWPTLEPGGVGGLVDHQLAEHQGAATAGAPLGGASC